MEHGKGGKANELVSSIVDEIIDIASSGGAGSDRGKEGGSDEVVVRGGSREGEIRVKCVLGGEGRKGFQPEAGKFVERRYNRIGSGRGRGVCEKCLGVCCSALRDMVHHFMKYDLIPAKPAV